ncbi:MAG TPA: TIGR03620 family F420-dependent LLM class oxidoreductase [Alphaproteobacteria bacterium]|nr:TIGR03620 family F420-dependent LLM class oxidoreductase [Alphaproteobacteria bacterium]
MKIGKLGAWAATESLTASAAAAFAKRVEGWGCGALWIPEAVGRNVLVHSSWLLANTTTLVIATGIANIYARDAAAMKSAQLTLAEQSGGRFLLGLGVSHVPLVEGLRGHVFEKPIGKMRRYLQDMQKVTYISPMPAEKPQTVIAALGPQMLTLTAELADGAHPYNVTPEHTAQARKALGPGKLLCPEQKAVLQTDPALARAAGRKNLSTYLTLPNYRNNMVRMGFTESDFESGGSDRFIDAMVAWGDEAAIRKRIQAHWDAGADHVCIQAIPPDGDSSKPADDRLLELLAPSRG